MMWASTKGAYLLTVQPDDFFPNPRREDENFGTMICFHRRYDLGDEHDYSNSDDLIKDLYIKAAGGGDRGEQKYEDLTEKYDVWPLSSQRIQELNQALMSQIEKMYVVLPVYLLDHSGLAMSTTDFNDRWDSGQVGIIFVSFDKIREEMEVSRITPSIKEKAEQMLREFIRLSPEMKVKVNAPNVDRLKYWLTICSPSYVEIAPEKITKKFRRYCRRHRIRVMAACQEDDTSQFRLVIKKKPDLVNLDRPEVFQPLLGRNQ